MTVEALAGLEPRGVWRHFGDLTRIPRPPRGEEGARAYVLQWARARGLEHAVDDAGNAVVRVEPSPGRERAATVVLQSHLDMVCERDPESAFDPRSGPLHVVRDGDWVRADGTTLGADNGIGVAAAMALAEDAHVPHGPLELVFTVCEEEGLEGARALDARLVRGRLLVNLDGSRDDVITIGCAGSAHTFVRCPLVPRNPREGETALRVAVRGGRGGHSGADIASGRANAIAVLGALLHGAAARVPFRLALVAGGVSRNAIPREAEALVSVAADEERLLRQALSAELDVLARPYAETDPELRLEVAASSAPAAGDRASTRRVLDVLASVPVGVVSWSDALPGPVETSTSLNVATTRDGVVTLASMTRSAVGSVLDDVVARMERLAREHGAEVEVLRSYPPWTPDPESRLLAAAGATYERLSGGRPGLEVVHGGLECAVLGEKLPGIDMIALGPRVEGPHAPGERLGIASTARFYRFLCALVDDLSAERGASDRPGGSSRS